MKKTMIGNKPGGIARFCMVLGLFLFLPLAALSDDGDNILVNGDFSKGPDGWGGDAGNNTDASDISAPLSGTDSTSGGIVVHLKDAIATRIFQAFESRNPSLTFTITCTPSSDCKFTGEGKVAKVATDIPPEVASRTYSTGNVIQTVRNINYDVYASGFRGPIVVIEDRDNDLVFTYPLRIDASKPVKQTVSVGIVVQIHKDYKILIAFPPGEGSIALSSVTLAKGAATLPQAP